MVVMMNATGHTTQTKAEVLARGEVEVPARIISHDPDHVTIHYEWDGGVTETIEVEDHNRYPLINESMSLGDETLELHGDSWTSRWSDWTAPVTPTVDGSYKMNIDDYEITFTIDLPWGEHEETIPLNTPNAKMVRHIPKDEKIDGKIRWVGGWFPVDMFREGYYATLKKAYVKRGTRLSGSFRSESREYFVNANARHDVLGERHLENPKSTNKTAKQLREDLRAREVDPTSDKFYRGIGSVSGTVEPDKTVRLNPTPDGWELTRKRTMGGHIEWGLSMGALGLFTLAPTLFLMAMLLNVFGMTAPEAVGHGMITSFIGSVILGMMWFVTSRFRR